MSDSPEMEKLHAPTIDSMAAFSKQLQEITDSLNLLSIRNNASGRNKFREKWPDVALFIFGEELIKFDNEGTDDRDRRSELENEASERRIQLKGTISEFIDKSVDKGELLFDYVGSVIDLYGAGITRFLYAEDVIERVRPGILANLVTAQDIEDAKKAKEEADRDEVFAQKVAVANSGGAVQGHKMPLEDQKLSVEEQSILSNASAPSAEHLSDEMLEKVKPIEVGAPPEQKRELNNPVSSVSVDEGLLPDVPNADTMTQPVIQDVKDDLDQQNILADNVVEETINPELIESVETSIQSDIKVEKTEGEFVAPTLPEQTAGAQMPDSPSLPPVIDPLDSIKPIDIGNAASDNLSVNAEISQKPEATIDSLPVVDADEPKNEVTDNVAPNAPQTASDPAQNIAPAAPELPPEELVAPPITETKVKEAPDNSVVKGTYVALFNAVAPIV